MVERYSSDLTQDYPLLLKAFPHSEEMHAEVGKVLTNHFDNLRPLMVIGLEIGSGGGETTKYLIESIKVRPNLLDLVDPDSIQMNRLLRDITPLARKSKVLIRAHKKDIFDYMPEVKENSYDFIASAWTIHNFEREKRNVLLKQIYRKLSPGGIFVNMDKYVPDNATEEQVLHNRQVKMYRCLTEVYQRPVLEKKMVEHDEDDRRPNLIMRESELQILKDIGFKSVQLTKRMYKEAIVRAIK